MVMQNNNFILLCTQSLSMDVKRIFFGFILFISLALTALAESPPVDDSAVYVKPKKYRVCPENEERRCRNTCPPETCVTLYAAFLCIQNQTCVDGCYCKKGFLRVGPKGQCVPPDQCNPLECVNDPNAEKGCGDKCGLTCADYKTNPICPKRPCRNDGCACKEGYIYDQNLSLCVDPKKCTKPCKANERYSTCLLSECVPKTCADVGKPVACPAIAADRCPGGCICDYGYVKDKDGKCIDAKTCPSCDGDPNAQAGCGNPCGKTCGSLNANNSELICPLYCESNGCDCKDGYLLNTDVKPPRCVLVKDCPKPPNKCGKNEEFYCGPSCPDSEASCSNPKPPTCINKKCELKCFCMKGFLRDANNNCIPPNKCPKQCTKPHERYSECLLGECIAKTCDDLGRPLSCPGIVPPCAGGCICEEGYVRDKDGNCIDAKTCRSCGGDPNAVTGCGNPCGRTCAGIRTNKRNKRDTSAVACATYCKMNGCDCKEGYILNTDVNPPRCVLPEDCDKPINCTKPNEKYIDCLAGQCLPKYCDDLGGSMSGCPFIKGSCPGGCICEEGYLRDSDGNCIKLEKCPAKPCGGNQTWMSPCNFLCPYPHCPRDDKPPPPCVEIKPCYPGCQCKLNYLRNSTGHCILAPDCPPVKCTRQNEIWDGCPSACLAENCDDVNRQPTTCNTLIWLCSPRCVCKKGHFRNKNGVCIPASQCPKQCKGPHEKYIDCPAGQCNPKTCDDLVNPPGCPRIKPPCPGGCVCEDGYLRNSKGICIKQEQCPSMQCKKPHERYSICLLGECVPKTCDDVGYPVPCPDIIGPCAGGCTCEEGFVRDCNGDCIDMKKCPCCGGDPNAVSGCGNPCGKTCASLYANKSDLVCPQYCQYNGCDCKPGFLLLESNNTDTSKCVPERECPKPPKCKGPHEIYIDCPAGQCNAKTCKDLIRTPPCPRVIPPCPGGCVCENGYLRNSEGICIKKELCPQACKANQTYVTCNINCPDKYCPKDDFPQPVCDPPRNCPPGCTCKINYKYDPSGNCILASECPPVNCTDQNAEWDPCPSACLSEQCEDADSPPVVCNTLLLNCQPRCVCKKGHFKNKDGLCVPAKKCPSVCKDPNASWTDCKDACPRTCQNTNPGCVNKKCSAGCQCNTGYVLSKIGGKCVKIEKCPDYANCGANQTFVRCTKCPLQVCPKSDHILLCKPPRDCPGGCGCKPYYRYNATGDCIKASDCPPVKCTGANQVWTSCQRISDWERCEDRYNSPPINPGDPDDCTPKCVCKKGYWRNNANKCVSENECREKSVYILRSGKIGMMALQKKTIASACKDPNASWTECMDACPRTCQNTNPGCVNVRCSAGCQCNTGYVLSKIGGKCVKIEECPDYANCCANQTFVPCTFKCPKVVCPKSDQILLCKPPRDCPGGCGCKPYYRYNATGDCIKAYDCPPVKCTGAHQVWKSCQRISDWERCDDRYNSPPINPGDPDDCTPKCVCNKGYWRNDANECVSENECPPIKQ